MRVPAGAAGSLPRILTPARINAAAQGAPKYLRSESEGLNLEELIVETPDHSLQTALLPDSHLANVLRVLKGRFDEFSRDPRIAHITIAKKHGILAGAAFEHAYWQLTATGVAPGQFTGWLQHARRFYGKSGRCVFCVVQQEELEQQTRIVLTSDHFVVLEPYASSSPFCTHVYPRRHMASFGEISDEEITDLAQTLRTLLAKLYYGLDDPDFNYTIRSAPAEYTGANHFHWYVSVIPRLTQVAGFELGSGMFINTVLPEAAAEFLRNVKIERAVGATAE